MVEIKLLHALVFPTLLYGCEVLGLSLRHSGYAHIHRVFVNMLSISIWYKRNIPYSIIKIEFDAYVMSKIDVFHIIKLLNMIHHMISTTPNSESYPLLAFKSSMQLVSKDIHWYWYLENTSLL